MVSYTSTVTAFVTQIEEDFTSIQEETSQLRNEMDDMAAMMDCVKLMIKMIMGICAGESTDYPLELANGSLKGKGLAMFNECIASMDGKDFTFSRYNLYQGRVGS